MRNAYSGYTYQQYVTLLLLAMMDVEREISKIEIEAKTDNKFDDLIITTSGGNYQFQIKDFETVSLADLTIKNSHIHIHGKPHKLSQNKNLVFFKHFPTKPNAEVLGFPCYKFGSNVFLISLSRLEIDGIINGLYKGNLSRKNEINSFFSALLDNRKWQILREELPQLKVFITELQEKSIAVSHKLLQFEKLLLIEGKPGVGKSHFANTLLKKYKDNILYRFWIGNQDRDYQERLKFSNFIKDINTKLFNDPKERSEAEILEKLRSGQKTFIIDGLDHVENYNSSDLDHFITFIDTLKDYCKVIVLSRPLVKPLAWEKHILENWNLKQTEKILKELFHLDNYSTVDAIFKISQGYPIIVKYLAEHYKLHHSLPDIATIENLDAYYQNVISNEKGKHSLSVFLCTKSYIMNSEIEMFIGDEKLYVDEFIKEHPYLFDIKLNRVSLFHDSFNTFLRKQIDYKPKKERVCKIVVESILNLEKRFLSRFSMFELPNDQIKKILSKYASIRTFEKIIKNAIDFEAVRTFYLQLREALIDVSPKHLSVNNYYDLSLIFNLIVRDHFSTINTFSYTYVQSLIAHGFIDDDITSSGYLFGMYYYVKTNNAVLLYNATANDHFGTEYFYEKLDRDVHKEDTHISKHNALFTKKQIDKGLKDITTLRNNVTRVIENFFIHKSAVRGYEVLKICYEYYLSGNEYKAVKALHSFLSKKGDNSEDYYARWILQDVTKNLTSYGISVNDEDNEFQTLTLKGLFGKYKNSGSFDLSNKIHTYIRLALLENRKIDLESVYMYWVKFYQRKDYTLYGLPIALHTLEGEGLISLKDCVALINSVQNASEKGNRHLLADLIELFPPSKIIPCLEKNFNTKELNVEWLKLPTKYINKISNRTFNLEKNEVISYHSRSPVSLEEVENVFYSNKFEALKLSLELHRKTISYKSPKEDKIINKFKDSGLVFEKYIEGGYDKYEKSSQQRFDSGILNFYDSAFIKRKKLKPADIAKFSDGNYTALPDIGIFKTFDSKLVSHQFKTILYNSLVNRTSSISYFYSLYYHPGNILTMIKLYRNDKEFKNAVNSFKIFLALSSFELKLKV